MKDNGAKYPLIQVRACNSLAHNKSVAVEVLIRVLTPHHMCSLHYVIIFTLTW